MRIAITTGGGDAPGLNAVIRAAVLAARARGWEVFGIRRGYSGLFQAGYGGVVVLDEAAVRGITHEGGTILGTTSRGNPFSFQVTQPDGSVRTVDRSGEVIDRFREMGIDCLIAIGGDGSLRIARDLARRDLNVIGVPKTIDNDLDATVVTFGFHTAVQTATDAIDKLHSTAEAHERIMVVELMGRHAGWIALFAGLAAAADVILIPEIPYRLDRVVEAIEARWSRGHEYAIVVVAEGALPVGGEASYLDDHAGLKRRLGGAARLLSRQLREHTRHETRSLVLGHLQRGGAPTAYDRIISLRFGSAAIELAERGRFGCMVALEPPDVKAVPLADAVRHLKTVPARGDVVRTARAVGISFGD
ncbi:MAG: ATP-dependent 6-phosphofructokinase [Gammaproteobacteria bacterium]|nr:ATP-dependent 6-phosphofructokinase [Gammaproteobacteria bacterium]MYC52366.1 ATP-dependent 6-phosphofructokinase [Gammaproteobacteria bacterium]